MSLHPPRTSLQGQVLGTSLQEVKRNLIRGEEEKAVCHCWRDVLICSEIRNETAVLCKLLKSRGLKNHIRNGNTAKTCIRVQMLHHWPRLVSLMTLCKTALILVAVKQKVMEVLIKDKCFGKPQTE